LTNLQCSPRRVPRSFEYALVRLGNLRRIACFAAAENGTRNLPWPRRPQGSAINGPGRRKNARPPLISGMRVSPGCPGQGPGTGWRQVRVHKKKHLKSTPKRKLDGAFLLLYQTERYPEFTETTFDRRSRLYRPLSHPAPLSFIPARQIPPGRIIGQCTDANGADITAVSYTRVRVLRNITAVSQEPPRRVVNVKGKRCGRAASFGAGKSGLAGL
jgi:hypothetical protein